MHVLPNSKGLSTPIPREIVAILEAQVLSYGLNLDRLQEEVIGHDPDTITIREIVAATNWIIEETNAPWLLLNWGRSADIAQTGTFGKILLSAKNIRHVYELYNDYSELSFPWFDLSYSVESGRLGCFLLPKEGVDLPPANIASLMASLLAFGERVLGDIIVPIEITFRHERPDYADKYTEHFQCEPKFSDRVDSMWVDAELLDRPFPSSSPNYHARARDEADKQLDGRSKYAGQAKRVVKKRLPDDSSMADVASVLCCSERTLQRRLSAEGKTFKELKQNVLKNEAITLLDSSSLSTEQIAYRLGYNQRSSFSIAFRTWTNTTPKAWRDRER